DRGGGVDPPPATRGGAAEGVDEAGQATDDGRGTRKVEGAEGGSGCLLLRDDPGADEERDEPHGSVDPEDELPAGPSGDRPAEQDAGGDAEAADGTPRRQSCLALRAGVGGHDQGQ